MAKLAIVGAGWAGLAAAVAATQAGHQAIIFEASRAIGGRARTVFCSDHEGHPLQLDNGQHILIGAYSATLDLMQTLGVKPAEVLHRRPLALLFADGRGLVCPNAPMPLDVLWGICRARGWQWRDRRSLLMLALRWWQDRFICAPGTSVATLCASLTTRVRAEMIEPLCVSALNTPPEQACAQVFLRVLQDALFGVRGGSNLLLPRPSLGAILPDAAQQWLQARGAQILLGQRLAKLQQQGAGWQLDGQAFDQVLLACPPGEAARLVHTLVNAPPSPLDPSIRQRMQDWASQALALRFTAISTVYAYSPSVARQPLAAPMLALRSRADWPAQFVFDKGQCSAKHGVPPGVLAFVVSASSGSRSLLEQQVLAQAAAQLNLHDLQLLQTVVEKRATFACTPALQRPPMQIAPGLRACGDYIAGPYPATLEGAVLSGLAAGSNL